MTDPIDTKARECAEKLTMLLPGGYNCDPQSVADSLRYQGSTIIAAAIREATEPLRHENNCLLVRLNAETDVLRHEATRLAAEVERLKADLKYASDIIQYYDGRTIEQLKATNKPGS